MCRPIPPGEELFIYYGDSYTQSLGLPLSLFPSFERNSNESAEASKRGSKVAKKRKRETMKMVIEMKAKSNAIF